MHTLTTTWRSATLALVLATAGCPDDEPKPTTSAAPPTASTTTSTSATAPSGTPTEGPQKLENLISEEDFKKLHELKGAAAPPPRGVMIELPSSKAYLSLPREAKTPLAAVVVIHEWWGLNGHIKHWSDRLTDEGYAALAVDLYGGKVAENPDDAAALMKAVDEAQARTILLEAFERLGSDARVKADKRAAIGWCFGGKWSLELALAAPTLSAAVVYYGHVETSPERLAKLEAPLLAIFGDRDTGVDPKFVETFAFGLEQAGKKEAKILSYDAEHAFANPSSARYDFAAAEKAWAETRRFLATHLKGPG